MQRKRVDYFYSIFNIFVYNYEYVGTLHMPPTFLIYSPFCHSTSRASSAWVMCLLPAYQKIVLLSETGERTQLSRLGILSVGRAHTLQITYQSESIILKCNKHFIATLHFDKVYYLRHYHF